MTSEEEVAVISGPPPASPPPNLPWRCPTLRLSVATGLTLCLVCAELTVGHHSRCLTLLALSDQTIYNLLTLIVALIGNQVQKSIITLSFSLDSNQITSNLIVGKQEGSALSKQDNIWLVKGERRGCHLLPRLPLLSQLHYHCRVPTGEAQGTTKNK